MSRKDANTKDPPPPPPASKAQPQPQPPDPEPEIPQWRRLSTRSSTIFSKTMSDFEAKMQERLRRQHEAMLARQRQQEAAGGGGEVLTVIEDDLEGEEEEGEEELSVAVVVDPHKEQVRKRAQRAWQIIKRYINEQRMKNKNQKSGMAWSFLKQTLSNMNNMEKARDDLYKKYLYNDDPHGWAKGLTHVPERLFQKKRGGVREEDARGGKGRGRGKDSQAQRRNVGVTKSKVRST